MSIEPVRARPLNRYQTRVFPVRACMQAASQAAIGLPLHPFMQIHSLDITPYHNHLNERAVFGEVLEEVKQTCPQTDTVMLSRAFNFADIMHGPQRRQSGEAYIVHPLETFFNLRRLDIKGTSILAAQLLHDVIEDTGVSKEILELEFGQEIANLVFGVTNLDIKSSDELDPEAKKREHRSNLLKVFKAMVEDLRIALIKLSDRLHNMETIKYMDEDKQKRTAQETMDIYAPIAGRLGLWRMKERLEHECFKVLDPHEFSRIIADMNKNKSKCVDAFNEFKAIVESLKLEFNVILRLKYSSPYHVHCMMAEGKRPKSELFNVDAFQIIVKEREDQSEEEREKICYLILRSIHTAFKYEQAMVRDLVGTGKENDYRSLHTTIDAAKDASLGWNYGPVQVQIRTEEMDRIARIGIAAHIDEPGQLPKLRVKWKELCEASPEEIFGMLKESVGYSSMVAVTSPHADTYQFPYGSSALDFAAAIHSRILSRAVGCTITNAARYSSEQFMPYVLQNDDRVEIRCLAVPENKFDVFNTARKSLILDELKRQGFLNARLEVQPMFDGRLEKFDLELNSHDPARRIYRSEKAIIFKILKKATSDNPCLTLDLIQSTKTEKAAKLLKRHFRSKGRQVCIDRGRERLASYAQHYFIAADHLINIREHFGIDIRAFLHQLSHQNRIQIGRKKKAMSIDDLYYAIGSGDIPVETVLDDFIGFLRRNVPQQSQKFTVEFDVKRFAIADIFKQADSLKFKALNVYIDFKDKDQVDGADIFRYKIIFETNHPVDQIQILNMANIYGARDIVSESH